MNVLSVCSGAGGLDLGLEAAVKHVQHLSHRDTRRTRP